MESDVVRTISIGAEIIVGHLPLGKHNARLAALRKAVQQGELTPEGLLPIEGPKLLEDAMRSGIEVIDVFLRRGVGAGRLPPAAAVYEVDSRTFKTLQTTETSQGIIALVRPPDHSLDRVLRQVNPLLVVLGRLQDPGNVGTMIRTAAAAGADQVVLSRDCAFAWSPKVLRAGQGAHFLMTLVEDTDLADWSARFRAEGGRVIATVAAGAPSVFASDLSGRAAIAIGSEGQGLSPALLAVADQRVTIPMAAGSESLNAAAAAAVLLFESVRQRTGARG